MARAIFNPPASMPALSTARDEDDSGGPGWYESSRELSRGLWVSEMPPADGSWWSWCAEADRPAALAEA